MAEPAASACNAEAARELTDCHVIPSEEKKSPRGSAYILLFDSLQGHVRSYGEIADRIRGYLTEEWRSKRHSHLRFTNFNLPLYLPLSPQQANSSDCGSAQRISRTLLWRYVHTRMGTCTITKA
ncbi:hypothetical protein HPB52_019175 [Rhipicephalus sanguineus]|uniref:Ubiquitin-like protease family profile domain-containing protein n=1 Tax=Rhipicephalus sanguineus TaxID=34632 RepID=A0A9D4YQM2_RHISA|nr:hypothetical protein HPB52_019175 [Rhipicephalus sanguineus]